MNNNNCLCRIFDDCNIWIIIIALLTVIAFGSQKHWVYYAD